MIESIIDLFSYYLSYLSTMIAHYMDVNPSVFFPKIMGGLLTTMTLTVGSLIIGLVCAVILTRMFFTKHIIWHKIARLYCFIFRGTPALVQFYIIYELPPYVPMIRQSFLWDWFSDAYFCALIALVLNTAAYTSIILRGAVMQIDKGQIEAARAIGMRKITMLRRVYIPNIIRIALPSYENEAILIMKSTVLASTITVVDLMGAAKEMIARYYTPYEIYFFIGALYLLLSFAISLTFNHIGRRVNKSALQSRA